ncbi:hypothetical protein CC80DRAFT_488876 [Byssothecium circinans]|uniref:Uncharacterized protein n=1 Tax=Byssothecium circinans TaxID=147558 RepID=A0A6A5U8A8_9PLEO|nr:hypothetical protein CC80DRAFT_488876 [Byssothecium circinans]
MTESPSSPGISRSARIGIVVGASCAAIVLAGVCLGAYVIGRRKRTHHSSSSFQEPSEYSNQKPALLHPTLLPDIDALQIPVHEMESPTNATVGRAELPEKQ